MYERSEGAVEVKADRHPARRESTRKTPIRPNGGAAGKHTWRGNALPPRRNRF